MTKEEIQEHVEQLKAQRELALENFSTACKAYEEIDKEYQQACFDLKMSTIGFPYRVGDKLHYTHKYVNMMGLNDTEEAIVVIDDIHNAEGSKFVSVKCHAVTDKRKSTQMFNVEFNLSGEPQVEPYHTGIITVEKIEE